jgi:hypothetical protein
LNIGYNTDQMREKFTQCMWTNEWWTVYWTQGKEWWDPWMIEMLTWTVWQWRCRQMRVPVGRVVLFSSIWWLFYQFPLKICLWWLTT